jgi:uncharacterized protein
VSAAEKSRRALPPDPPPALASEGSVETRRPTDRPRERSPFLLDFFPLEGSGETRLSRFYDALREGRLTTTRCRRDGELHWPPRVVCPKCHEEDLEWTDLPLRGSLYAFSAVLAGAPLGMESDVPYAVGLVDLVGVPLRLFGRVDGKPWAELAIGERVVVEPYEVGDGRVFYRFRVGDVPRASSSVPRSA